MTRVIKKETKTRIAVFLLPVLTSKLCLIFTYKTLFFSKAAIDFQAEMIFTEAIRRLGKTFYLLTVVVTQLAERSLPNPEVSGSNTFIGKIL